MRDYFGQDAGAISESATTDPPQAPAAMTTTTAPVATTGPAPTLQQAVDKAAAKASADAQVAVDPNAVHHVKLAPLAPTVVGSAAVGAAIGMGVGGPPGAAIGAGVGWIVERYQIGGGPAGKVWLTIKRHMHKLSGAAPAATTPAAAPAAAAAAAPPPAGS